MGGKIKIPSIDFLACGLGCVNCTMNSTTNHVSCGGCEEGYFLHARSASSLDKTCSREYQEPGSILIYGHHPPPPEIRKIRKINTENTENKENMDNTENT